MKILIICHYGLYQNLTSSFVHNQARAYAALGHEVRVIVPIALGKAGHSGSRLFPAVEKIHADGVEIAYLRYLTLSSYGEKGFNTASAIGAVRICWGKLFDAFTPDVIHAHTIGFDSQIGVWLKKKFSCPLVVTTHGSDTNVPLAQGRHEFLRECCDGADQVIAVSSVLGNNLRSCGTKTPVVSILNGFNASFAHADEEKNPLQIVQVSNLLKQKRVHITIQAFAKLKQKYPQAALKIIGPGPERENLEVLCREMKVSDAVEFTGFLPNRDSMARMAKARFFVMPSVREGLGVVYLEAMANGCITIGTQGEGIGDLISNEKNGFLVPPDSPEAIAEVIERCIQNPEWAQSIAEQGVRDVQELTWEANARKYIARFEELLSC